MNWQKFVEKNNNYPLPGGFNAKVSWELAALKHGKNKSKTLTKMVY